jgi:hypothetical protein
MGNVLSSDPYGLFVIRTHVYFCYLKFTQFVLPFCYKKYNLNWNAKSAIGMCSVFTAANEICCGLAYCILVDILSHRVQTPKTYVCQYE